MSFITHPGDTFTIKAHSRCISSSIAVHVENPMHEEKTMPLKNCLDAWKLLKELNEMGGRKVLYKIDDNEPIPFEDSMPYKHRFTDHDNKYRDLTPRGWGKCHIV